VVALGEIRIYVHNIFNFKMYIVYTYNFRVRLVYKKSDIFGTHLYIYSTPIKSFDPPPPKNISKLKKLKSNIIDLITNDT